MTLNGLIKACEEEGISKDEELRFFTNYEQEAYLLSVYRDANGKATIDIGDE